MSSLKNSSNKLDINLSSAELREVIALPRIIKP
jgi:hypothetical protein